MDEATLIRGYQQTGWTPDEIPRPTSLDGREPCVGPACMTLLPPGSGRVLCQFCERGAREAGSLAEYRRRRGSP